MDNWISCDDKMPEKHIPVLIAKGDNIGHARRRVTSWCIIASNDIVVWDDVTHWQYLPPPPETKQ